MDSITENIQASIQINYHLRLVPRLSTRGDVPSLSPYVSWACMRTNSPLLLQRRYKSYKMSGVCCRVLARKK